MREFLSNRILGRPPKDLASFRDLPLSAKLTKVGRSPTRNQLIWLLHYLDQIVPLNPTTAKQPAEVCLAAAWAIADPDLASWAESVLGNIYRLTGELAEAEKHLDVAIEIAVSPAQKADAVALRGLLAIWRYNFPEALKYLEAARQLSPQPRINSDRGYTRLIELTALAHLWHAMVHTQDQDRHIRMAESLYTWVLKTGSPRHAPRARRAALNNLTAIPIFFEGRQADPNLRAELHNYYTNLALKNTLEGSRIRWVLVRSEIIDRGYNRARRIRLLRIRDQIVDAKAWPDAALLILDIAALDLTAGRKRAALFLLRKNEKIFKKAGLAALSANLLRIHLDLDATTLREARQEAASKPGLQGKANPPLEKWPPTEEWLQIEISKNPISDAFWESMLEDKGQPRRPFSS